MFKLENILAVGCAMARLAVCCYRAAHQSLIVDEATTYNQFVSGPWRKLFGRYDANNHILSSIMVKLSVTLCGLSEFKLRLPSLIAGFFLTLGVFWLLKQVESTVLRWAAFIAFCLCPLLLDFSIAARGYSLSLAFFVWALYFCQRRRYLPAGALLGLSMGANLAIIFPTLALLLIISLFELRPKPIAMLILPALLLGAAINGPSLRRAQRGDVYIGYDEYRTAAISFVATALYAMPDHRGILGERGVAIVHIVDFGLPFFWIAVAAASMKVRDRRKLLPFAVLSLALLGLSVAHWWFGLKYPADRTCMYFLILGPVSWVIAADAFKSRMVQALALLPLIVLALQFSTQLQTRYFEFWRVEADDKIIAGLIKRDSAGKPDHSLALSTSWMHQPTMEFYRRYLHISALKPVERLEPTPLTGFDFYLLSWGDFYRGKAAPLRTVFTDPPFEVMLAEPISSGASREGN